MINNVVVSRTLEIPPPLLDKNLLNVCDPSQFVGQVYPDLGVVLSAGPVTKLSNRISRRSTVLVSLTFSATVAKPVPGVRIVYRVERVFNGVALGSQFGGGVTFYSNGFIGGVEDSVRGVIVDVFFSEGVFKCKVTV